MLRDKLLLLKPDFMDQDQGPYYCPACATIEGLLGFYPKLRNALDVVHVDFPRPRAAVIAEIGADVMALQEADTRFGTRTGLLDLEHLERETGLIPVPVQGVGPAHGWHGNLILVREANVEDLHQIHLPGFEPRGALVADLRIFDRKLRVIGAHLGLLRGSRDAQVRAILHQMAALDDRPTLLMGSGP